MRMASFENINVGDQATLAHLITKEDVENFATLTGDFNPLHVDEDFAKQTLFQKPVVHGMLSASFISTMIGMVLPGPGALWMSQTLEFLRPSFIGDTLTIRATVKQKSIATRVLVLTTTIINQHGHELIKGESTVKVLEINDKEKGMNSHEKKTILITGASGGIGAAAAKTLAAAGHQVIVHYHASDAAAQNVVSQIKQAGGHAMMLKANIANAPEVSTMFEVACKAMGPIHAVVHCAGPENSPKAFDFLDWSEFQEQMDVHLKGAFLCAKAAIGSMVQAKSGDIILIGTVYTDGVPPVQQSRYIVAKSALTSFARCLAVEYGPSNVRVNVVAPGMTETSMIADLPDKVKMLTKMQTPLRRLAEASDIADTIAFLLSPGAKHITGQTIRVCGGSVMA